MKIIDKEKKRRADGKEASEASKRQQSGQDPEALEGNGEWSPYNPPGPDEAVKPEEVPYEKMPALIQKLIDEHERAKEELSSFEETLNSFKQNKWVLDESMSERFQHFFQFLDREILEHNQKEEALLFPLLAKRLREAGEHGKMQDQEGEHRTGVDIMEDDHVKFIQYSTLVFHFLGLSEQLPDIGSQSIVADLAYNKGMELSEMLRLHIEREDTILFPQAYQLISKEEFEEMEAQMKEEYPDAS
jgi:hemerythrin-like domain-containing protein